MTFLFGNRKISNILFQFCLFYLEIWKCIFPLNFDILLWKKYIWYIFFKFWLSYSEMQINELHFLWILTFQIRNMKVSNLFFNYLFFYLEIEKSVTFSLDLDFYYLEIWKLPPLYFDLFGNVKFIQALSHSMPFGQIGNSVSF